LIELLSKAQRWFTLLRTGQYPSVFALAQEIGSASSDVTQVVYLAFLAPDLVQRIVAGKQADGVGHEEVAGDGTASDQLVSATTVVRRDGLRPRSPRGRELVLLPCPLQSDAQRRVMHEAVSMDTIIGLGLLAVTLIPLVQTLRDAMTVHPRQVAPGIAAFYEATTTLPRLSDLQESEQTLPTFVKRREWWTE
jgi:hypothetical protein